MTQGECMTITKQEAQDALEYTDELAKYRSHCEALSKAGWKSEGELLEGYDYIFKMYTKLLVKYEELVLDTLEKE
jgi:hypothetical protein